MRTPVLLSLLLSAALASPASAQMPDLRDAPQPRPDAEEAALAQARAAAWQDYALRVAGDLARSDGARDLALAALLQATARPGEEGAAGARSTSAVAAGAPSTAAAAEADAERWRTQAAARGANDVVTQQLLLAAAHARGDADAAVAAARRWQALSPGNLAPLMHQGLDAIAVLAAAAQAGHNAPDPYPMMRWAAAALTRHPPTAAEWAAFGDGPRPDAAANAAVWASSLYVGWLLPGYQDVLGACTGRQLDAPGRAGACGHLAGLLLARPQTVLDERIGLSMARALTRSAAERAPLDARRRGVDWRQEQLAELVAREEGDAAAAERQARLLADPAIDSEDALVRRILADAGLAQEPPAAWRAPWERAPR